MQLYVLDTSFIKIAIIDSFQSTLWIDRYNQPGEFELYMGADAAFLQFFKIGNYLIQKDSEHVMVIESVKVETDTEQGNHFTIKGRSVESFLDRRIIWKQTDFGNVNLQTAIQRLLNENMLSPEISERRINGIIFESTSDSYINGLKLSAQYTGDNLLETIVEICQSFNIGFKMVLNSDNQFVFSLYSGTDRSYDQTEQTYVVFSPDFDNIINSNYYEDITPYKNVTLVAGEGEGPDRLTFAVGTASDLARRELFTDARDISRRKEYEEQEISDDEWPDKEKPDGDDSEEDEFIPIEEYNEKLKQRGLEKLTETTKEKTFDGKVDSSRMFVYGEDFFIGDIVQIKNEFGIEGSARVIEYVMSENIEEGLSYYPTFEAIQEDAEE